MRTSLATIFMLLLTQIESQAADEPIPLKSGVRGLITKVVGGVRIDGKLDEWEQAFSTPVHYNHRDLANRAAQFFYMWDDAALYIGLRALDTKQANPAPLAATYNGDAVEFYLDTRRGAGMRGKDWSEGAIHFFFSPFQGGELKPRWAMRSGIATSGTMLEGVAIAATNRPDGYEVEFKLPWSNFPDFQPKLGSLLALDAELCSGDGGARTDRTFAYGSPLSVQQPASLGTVELVHAFDPDYLPIVGPAAFPMWVDAPWTQPERAQLQAVLAIPPVMDEVAGQVEVRIHDADGKIVRTIPAPLESFGPPEWGFQRAVARWSIDDFAPNTFMVSARVLARTGKVLTTVTPRLIDEANMTGR